jgi:hypothetical protein
MTVAVNPRMAAEEWAKGSESRARYNAILCNAQDLGLAIQHAAMEI